MQLAWLEPRLREVCVSELQLQLRYGPTATRVKLILTVLAQSDCLQDVRAHQCLRVTVIPPTTAHEVRLLIRHKEIDVTAEPLTEPTLVQRAHATRLTWLDPVRRLRIVSIDSHA